MRSSLIPTCLALALPTLAPAKVTPESPEAVPGETPQVPFGDRPYTAAADGRPVLDGIVWYGTWEAAMAEMERTGKPVMLHMGSPRDRKTCVPGTW